MCTRAVVRATSPKESFARYRSGFTQPELLEPGEVAEYHIELAATSNVFLKGHRLRVEISSSNFPRFNRNLMNSIDRQVAL
jgi:predicted acyl esterase